MLQVSSKQLSSEIQNADIEYLKSLQHYSIIGDQTHLYIYGGQYIDENLNEVLSDRFFTYDLTLNQLKEIKPLVPDKKKPKKKTFWPPSLSKHQSWLSHYQSNQQEEQEDQSARKPVYLFLFGGILKYEKNQNQSEILHSNQIYAFHILYSQWFKLFQMEPIQSRFQPNIIQDLQVDDCTIIIFGGFQLSQNQEVNNLTDMWILDTKFVPTITMGDRYKKKDLTGAVWSQVDYRVSIPSQNKILESRESRNWLQELQFLVVESNFLFGIYKNQNQQDILSVLKFKNKPKNQQAQFSELQCKDITYQFMSPVLSLNAKQFESHFTFIIQIDFEQQKQFFYLNIQDDTMYELKHILTIENFTIQTFMKYQVAPSDYINIDKQFGFTYASFNIEDIDNCLKNFQENDSRNKNNIEFPARTSQIEVRSVDMEDIDMDNSDYNQVIDNKIKKQLSDQNNTNRSAQFQEPVTEDDQILQNDVLEPNKIMSQFSDDILEQSNEYNLNDNNIVNQLGIQTHETFGDVIDPAILIDKNEINQLQRTLQIKNESDDARIMDLSAQNLQNQQMIMNLQDKYQDSILENKQLLKAQTEAQKMINELNQKNNFIDNKLQNCLNQHIKKNDQINHLNYRLQQFEQQNQLVTSQNMHLQDQNRMVKSKVDLIENNFAMQEKVIIQLHKMLTGVIQQNQAESQINRNSMALGETKQQVDLIITEHVHQLKQFKQQYNNYRKIN